MHATTKVSEGTSPGTLKETTEHITQGTASFIGMVTTVQLDDQSEASTTKEATTPVTGQSTVALTPTPATTTTTMAPVTVAGITQNVGVDIDHTGQIKITNLDWESTLLDSNSPAYHNLETQILSLVSDQTPLCC